MSHPLRVRGLKQGRVIRIAGLSEVAPFTGAWIETANIYLWNSGNGVSHPLRVRGLKRSYRWRCSEL